MTQAIRLLFDYAQYKWVYHTSSFSRDSPGLKALSRCPGQSTKKSRLGMQSANMKNMWSDGNRM